MALKVCRNCLRLNQASAALNINANNIKLGVHATMTPSKKDSIPLMTKVPILVRPNNFEGRYLSFLRFRSAKIRATNDSTVPTKSPIWNCVKLGSMRIASRWAKILHILRSRGMAVVDANQRQRKRSVWGATSPYTKMVMPTTAPSTAIATVRGRSGEPTQNW